MASVVKNVIKSVREKGFGAFLRELKDEGYLRCLPDGNLLQTKIQNIGATLVGVDKAGNKYYEKLGDTQFGKGPALCLNLYRYLSSKPNNSRRSQHDPMPRSNSQLIIYPPSTKGRHRWVEYAEKNRYNASQVPPEWHGWLHFITDHTGDELLLLKPKRYGVEHKENLSGEGEQYIYHSKGHALNPGQRDWTRYQPWESKA
ncbi:putative NADH dehydrogenase [ubiquinone] 1 alpha subcomplex subunit 12 [Mucuna pruriens]|uniref:NADH dehydrogenase [ubiquinone] 1 alpha subcomplex subunit 12 n=1 Tax=Mucuna pruriens TaxID=157652 RepID=A0A371IGF5_MUCPR|nr:putative NADH dehydrogenase [ubiquinone] 1 alpha subcomplex subunit 12 [Mucuna pruriens]